VNEEDGAHWGLSCQNKKIVFTDTLITLSNLELDAKATVVKYEMVIK